MKKLRILLLIIISVYVCIGTVFSESPPANSPWSGTFIREATQFTKATLEITPITNSSFNFNLQAFSGGNTGGVSGNAQIIGTTALYTNEQGGVLKFTLNEDMIKIEEENMGFYQGMGVFFEGEYINEKKPKPPVEKANYFTDCNVFKGNQEQEFKQLVSNKYKKFTNTAQYVSEYTNRETFEVRAYQMNVRGLFTILESIIMVRDSDNTIWAAVIDGDKVLYFTNAQDKKIPKTILHWQERFKDKPICLVE